MTFKKIIAVEEADGSLFSGEKRERFSTYFSRPVLQMVVSFIYIFYRIKNTINIPCSK
jgi:hypothetical protein